MYITCKIIQMSIWCQYFVFILSYSMKILFLYLLLSHRIFLLLHYVVGIAMQISSKLDYLRLLFYFILFYFILKPYLMNSTYQLKPTHPPHPGQLPLCSCFSDLGDFSSSITWSSTCHHLFATAGMTINKLHSLACSLSRSLHHGLKVAAGCGDSGASSNLRTCSWRGFQEMGTLLK